MKDWRKELGEIMEGQARVTRAEQENAEFEAFLAKVAVPALTEVADEFNAKRLRDAKIRAAPASATLSVTKGDVEEISFRILKRFVANSILPSAEVRVNRGACSAKYESMFRPDPQTYPITAVKTDDVIACFIKYYRLVKEGGGAQ